MLRNCSVQVESRALHFIQILLEANERHNSSGSKIIFTSLLLFELTSLHAVIEQ